MCGSRIRRMSHTHANDGAESRWGWWGGQGVHSPLEGWVTVPRVAGVGRHTEGESLRGLP